MEYLNRLISEKRPLHVPPKLPKGDDTKKAMLPKVPKAPYDSFGSTPLRHILKNGADETKPPPIPQPTPMQAIPATVADHRRPAPPDKEAMDSIKAALPWVKDHLGELLAAGWTRAEVYRRGRFRWPYGEWGAAWLSSWSDPGKTPSIGRRGEIVFSFMMSDSRPGQQTAWSDVTNPIFKEDIR